MSLADLLRPSGGQLRLLLDAPELEGFAAILEALADNGAVTLTVTGGDGSTTLIGTAHTAAKANVQVTIVHDASRILTVQVERSIEPPDWSDALPFGLADLRQVTEARARDDAEASPLIEQALEATARLGPASGHFRVTHEWDNRFRIELICDPSSGPKLDDIVHLVGRDGHADGDLRWLPEKMRDATLVGIESIAIVFDFDISSEPLSAEVALQFLGGTAWPVIPDLAFPEIGALRAVLEIEHPLDPDLRFAEIALSGSLLIDPKPQDKIDITARWPDLLIHGELAPGGRILLGSLLGKVGLPTSLLPDGEDALNIGRLSFTASPLGKRKSFGLAAEVEVEKRWPIRLGGGKTLALEDLKLDALWSSDGGAGGMLQARVAIGGEDILLVAGAEGGGWTFSGELEGKPLAVGKWLMDFIDASHLPQPIHDATIETATVQLSTLRRELSFSIDCQVPMGGPQPVNAALSVRCAPDAAKGWQAHIEGKLFIDDFELDVAFDKGGRLMAVLRAEETQHASIGALVAALGGPAGLDIALDLQTALAATVTTSAKSGGGSERLGIFAVDIGAGIDISNLPLVGPLIHIGDGLSVGFQLVFASRALGDGDAQMVTDLNALLPARAMPLPEAKKIGKDLGLGVSIVAAGEPTVLELPVKADQATGEPVHDPAAPALSTSADGVKWIDLDKHFGPAHFKRVGMVYANSEVRLLVDAEIALGPVSFSMTGLSVASKISPIEPHFDLAGLGLSFTSGPVEISGAFLHETSGGIDEYAGTALIRTEELTLAAIGIYEEAAGKKSLAVYAVLDQPLGGPAFFFVTGLAAGFGYNRALALPPIDKVSAFPLVSFAAGTRTGKENLRAELAAMRDALPVAFDEYFLAVGIKFNSFKLINSFALVVVQFGRHLEVDLLGLSTAVLPSPEAGKMTTPLAVIQVALKASLLPEEGILRVEAQLTPASFVLSRDCRLTGGFAFYAWLKGAKAGEFVATLGGYHPQFPAPPDYPRPPRVGLNWPVDRHLQVKGDLYCALTPVAMMAGGHLEATFQDGGIHAWFKAGVDFLIAWKPCHYTAQLDVDVGGSYTFDFIGTHTITIDVGASLDVWGPEFSGIATVDLYVCSFDVAFGAGGQALPQPISWQTFEETLLPARDAVASIAIVEGLIGMADDFAIVAPAYLRLATDSAIPAKAIEHGAGRIEAASTKIKVEDAQLVPTSTFGVGPVGVSSANLDSVHKVTVNRFDNDVKGPDVTAKLFQFSPRAKQAPAAMWGESLVPSKAGLDKRFVGWALSGLNVSPAPSTKPGQSPVPDRSLLVVARDVPARIPVATVGEEHLADGDGSQRRAAIETAIADPKVAARRAAILTAVGLRAESELLLDGLADDFRTPPLVRATELVA